MPMKLAILVDNYAGRQDLKAEHGLSFWLEPGKENILFDTGQAGAIMYNAPRMGIDLNKTDILVLSHGHYDHTGMLGQVLIEAGNIPVWAHSQVDCSHRRHKNGTRYFIGCNINRESLDLREVEGKTEITDHVWAISVPLEKRDPKFFSPPPHLQLPSKEGWITDTFDDDISLVVEGEEGLSVILGCAHAGIVNILEEAASLFGTRDFYSVTGGMHIGEKSRDYVSTIVDELLTRFNVKKWVPCHCTGFPAAAELYSREQDVVFGRTGMSLSI